MKRDIINALYPKAKLLAWVLGCNEGRWHGFNPQRHNLVVNNSAKSEVIFKHPSRRDSWIRIYDIRPKGISNVKFHPPTLGSKEVTDASSFEFRNNTGSKVTKEYESVSSSSSSVTDTIGIGIRSCLSQTIGYGSPIGASGQTSLEIEITASFEKEMQNTKKNEHRSSILIPADPYTSYTVTEFIEVSKMSQQIDYTCDLDFSIEFENWYHNRFLVDSMVDITTATSGDGYPNLFNWKPWWRTRDRAIRSMHRLHHTSQGIKDSILKPLQVQYTEIKKFDRAVTGSMSITQTPLKKVD